MKIALINTYKKLIAKKSNIAWIVFGYIIIAAVYNYFNTTKLPIAEMKAIAANDNYTLYLIGTLVVGMVLYRSLSMVINFNMMQKFTFGIKTWQITALLIGTSLTAQLVLLGAPIKTIYTILTISDYKFIIGLLVLSNLINYAFSTNVLGKILAIITIIITKFTYTTKYGILIYAVLASLTFLITFATQDRFFYNFTKKMSFAFIVKSKFIESIIYMFRYTKSISIYISFTLIMIYTILPKQYQIHYQIGNQPFSYYVQMIFIFSLLYIAVSGLIFTREKNLYVTLYNPNIYVHFYIFNAIFFTLMSYLSAMGRKHGLENILFEAAYELQSVVGIFIVSAIIRKRSILTVFISIIIVGIIQQRISNVITSHWILDLINLGILLTTIIYEYVIAKIKQVKIKG